MAGRKNDAATTPAEGATAEAKAKRVVGPRTAWLIFKPGTPKETVEAVKDALSEVTLNSRALLKALQGGEPAPFLSYTVQVETRGGDDQPAA